MSKPGTDEPALTVRALTPTSVLYTGKAVSVTATNKVGPFDVFAGHANFFSLLSGPQVTINTGVENRVFSISQGLMKVKGDNVTLFVDIEPVYLAGPEVTK